MGESAYLAGRTAVARVGGGGGVQTYVYKVYFNKFFRKKSLNPYSLFLVLFINIKEPSHYYLWSGEHLKNSPRDTSAQTQHCSCCSSLRCLISHN